MLMPKPVTVHDSIVRLKADMSNPDIKGSSRSRSTSRTSSTACKWPASTWSRAQDTPNRQIILITDGLPTSHYELQSL